MKVPSSGNSNDRLVNAANSSVRSYATVNRPTGHLPANGDRPHSHLGI